MNKATSIFSLIFVLSVQSAYAQTPEPEPEPEQVSVAVITFPDTITDAQWNVFTAAIA